MFPFHIKLSNMAEIIERNVKFAEHLKAELSAAQFEVLYETMGITLYRFNKLMNGKTDWKVPEIGVLASQLQRDPLELIMEFGIGRNLITLEEMDQLAADQGLAIALVANAA